MAVEYFNYERGEMLDLVPAKIESLLDVGCGEGNFGALVKRKFECLVWGVEPEMAPYLKAKDKLDHVIHGMFNNTLDLNRKFDVIAFNDVLEHMPDPWSTLTYAKRFLKPKGVVIASIPNILYFHDFFALIAEKDWRYQQSGIFDKTHLRFFTRRSMNRMFEECGFKVTREEGIHPTNSKKYFIFNIITLGYWSESKYLQFAIQATPADQ